MVTTTRLTCFQDLFLQLTPAAAFTGINRMTIGPDAAEMRQFILSLIDWSNARNVLDIGCGAGYDLYKAGEYLPTGQQSFALCGLDRDEQKIAIAKSDKRHDQRYSFIAHDLSEKMPYPNHNFDIVFSHNVLECIPDKTQFLSEVHRILKPGGQFLCAHFDWDSAFYNGRDKALIRRIVHAYADWKQGWMEACDGWMGRRLWGTINASSLFVNAKIIPYQLVNTTYEFPYYGFESVQAYAEMVKANIISGDEYEEFKSEIESVASSGEYFFSITTFIYLGLAL